MLIYCCACKADIDAILVSGEVIYPHRKDLYTLPFWQCNTCKNFVGCHHKTKNRTKPLGNIPTASLRSARKHIHAILDPLYISRRISRGKLYAIISEKIGYSYHTAEIRDIEEARKIYKIIKEIERGFI